MHPTRRQAATMSKCLPRVGYPSIHTGYGSISAKRTAALRPWPSSRVPPPRSAEGGRANAVRCRASSHRSHRSTDQQRRCPGAAAQALACRCQDAAEQDVGHGWRARGCRTVSIYSRCGATVRCHYVTSSVLRRARRPLSPGESRRAIDLIRCRRESSNPDVSLATRGAPPFRAKQGNRRHARDARGTRRAGLA
jgi:hypothetical protein